MIFSANSYSIPYSILLSPSNSCLDSTSLYRVLRELVQININL